MTLMEWGAIGELVGGVAIIGSLIYVGLQVKQGTQSSRAATTHAFLSQYSELLMRITEADFRDVFWHGLRGLKNLKGSEVASFMAFMATLLRTLESFYYQKKEGIFAGEIFDTWMIQYIDLFGHEGVREYWAVRKHQFSAEFVSWFDEQLATLTPTQLYPAEVFGTSPGVNDSA